MLLHVLRHVDSNHRVLAVEHQFSERASQLCLADAGRAEEEKGADRAVWILKPGARATQRASDGGDGFVLADYALVQAVFEEDELVGFGLFDPCDRNAGPTGDDLGNVFAAYVFLEEARWLRIILTLDVFFHLLLKVRNLSVAQLGGALKVAFTRDALKFAVGLV